MLVSQLVNVREGCWAEDANALGWNSFAIAASYGCFRCAGAIAGVVPFAIGAYEFGKRIVSCCTQTRLLAIRSLQWFQRSMPDVLQQLDVILGMLL